MLWNLVVNTSLRSELTSSAAINKDFLTSAHISELIFPLLSLLLKVLLLHSMYEDQFKKKKQPSGFQLISSTLIPHLHKALFSADLHFSLQSSFILCL